MTALLAAAAWLGAAALGSVAVEADARLAARGREVRVEDGPTRSTGELEVVPRLALLRHGRLALSLSYAPRLTLPTDLSAGAPELKSRTAFRDSAEVLHRGELAVRGGATRNLSLGLRTSGAYGRIDLLRSEIYAEDVLPTTGRLAWRSIRITGEAAATPTPRTRLSATMGAFETGGADDEARQVAPLQRGALVEAILRHEVTRRDELSLRASGAYSDFTPSLDVGDAAIVRLGAGWLHRLGPTLHARAEAGAAWSRSDAPGVAASRALAPVAEAGLSHTADRPAVTTELAVRVAPYLSSLTGAIDQRLEATATTAWRVSRRLTLSARAGAAATRSETSDGAFWTGERQAELASVDLRARWAFARHATLAIGPRARWQRSHEPSVPTFAEWGVEAELAVGRRWPAPTGPADEIGPRPD